MTEYYREYLAVAVLMVAALLMVGGILALGRLLRPSTPRADKYVTYEAGSDPVGGWGQSNVRYYVYALLFVMFDVEAVFIFPWAIQLEALGVQSLDLDDRVHRDPRPRPRLRLAQGSPAVGLISDRRSLSGPRREGPAGQEAAEARHLAPQLQPEVLAVDVPVGPRVLRDRDGRRARQPALRHDAPRRDPVPGQPAPGRPRRDLGHGHRQDGAGDQAALRADARPEVRDLDGLVRQLRRPVLGLVLGHQGRRPDHPGRHLHPGLPAPARGAAPGDRHAPGADPERGHRQRRARAPVGVGSRSPLPDEPTPDRRRGRPSRRPTRRRAGRGRGRAGARAGARARSGRRRAARAARRPSSATRSSSTRSRSARSSCGCGPTPGAAPPRARSTTSTATTSRSSPGSTGSRRRRPRATRAATRRRRCSRPR